MIKRFNNFLLRTSHLHELSSGTVQNKALLAIIHINSAFITASSQDSFGFSKTKTPGDSTEKEQTWPQFSRTMRFHRRRYKVIDFATKASYQYRFIKKIALRKPELRQWIVRDDYCNMDPGVIEMSPAMQHAFMRLYRSKSKSAVRQALREFIPMMDYRLLHEQTAISKVSPEDMIPRNEPMTLNAKKKQMYEKTEMSGYREEVLRDEEANHRLRWQIRLRLLKFQRKAALMNSIASRSVMYSEQEGLAYFLWRGPLVYAAMHRVLFELGKWMPWFIPKTMLDFGAGTGSSILATKEVYDPGALVHPIFRDKRNACQHNPSSKEWLNTEFQYDLNRLDKENSEKKKARFLAVAAMIEREEIKLSDLPPDLRKQMVEVAKSAHQAAKERVKKERFAKLREAVSKDNWSDDDLPPEYQTPNQLHSDVDSTPLDNQDSESSSTKTWWERYTDTEYQDKDSKVKSRLKPLQQIIAIEPSPGMMETAISVLGDEVSNIQWHRFLTPEHETESHDLVIACYTLSEIADSKARSKIIQQLWKCTKGVLILIEHGNIPGYNIIMEARDQLLEEKEVGLWDWKPTIVSPCPHEKKCPIRFSKLGVKHRKHRVCRTNVYSRSTFIEKWARQKRLIQTIEPISYIVFTRNMHLPDKVEEKKAQDQRKLDEEKRQLEIQQKNLYEASLKIEDVVFERLSEEALVRPSDQSHPLEHSKGRTDSTSDSALTAATGILAAPDASEELYKPVFVEGYNKRYNKLVKIKPLPVASHRYNRAPVLAPTYQQQRVVTPAEMAAVRGEVSDLQEHCRGEMRGHYRVVSQPECRGRVVAKFCTPDAALIEGRVYRRYVGGAGPRAPGPSERAMWQRVGGWALLKQSQAGSLFPANVPLHNIRVLPQVTAPNTLLNAADLSHIERVAMQLDDPLNPAAHNPAHEDPDDKRHRARLQKAQEDRDSLDLGLHALGLSSNPGPELSHTQRVDSRTPLSPIEWARAVKSAKRNASRLSSKSNYQPYEERLQQSSSSRKVREALKTGKFKPKKIYSSKPVSYAQFQKLSRKQQERSK